MQTELSLTTGSGFAGIAQADEEPSTESGSRTEKVTKVRDAYADRMFGVRSVMINPIYSVITRSSRESAYLDDPQPNKPRPVSVPASGLPLALYEYQCQLITAMQLEEPQYMYSYKRNGNTMTTMDPADRSHRDRCKLLPPDVDSFRSKQDEMGGRLYSMYPEKTSGHFLPDGSFQEGKPPHRNPLFGLRTLSFNEVVVTGYRKEQLLGTVITDTMPFIEQEEEKEKEKEVPSWILCLENWQTLQKEAGLEELPIIFYDSHRGMICDICFYDELIPSGYSLQDLKQMLTLLQEYCLENNVPFQQLSSALWQLGPREAVKRLFSCFDMLKLWKENYNKQANNDLYCLIRSGSLEPEKYIALLEKGANFHHKVLFRSGKRQSLLHLLFYGFDKFHCSWSFAYNCRKNNTPECELLGVKDSDWPDEETIKKAMAEHKKKLADLTKTLAEKGHLAPEDLPDVSCTGCDTDDLAIEILKLGGKYRFVNSFYQLLMPYLSDPEKTDLCSLETIIRPAVIQFSPECLSRSILSICSLINTNTFFKWPFGPPDQKDVIEKARVIKTLVEQGAQVSPDSLEVIDVFIPGFQEEIRMLMDSDKAKENRRRYHQLWQSHQHQWKETSQEAGEYCSSHCLLHTLFDLTPLNLNAEAPLEETAQRMLDHYYLRYHPKQAMHFLDDRVSEETYPEEPRIHHGADHVVRTMRICQALIELHKRHSEEYRSLFKHPQMEKLMALAMLYHDVVAEVEPKQSEEQIAAEWFKRDMLQAGFEPSAIELVAGALKNKNVGDISPDNLPFATGQSDREQKKWAASPLLVKDQGVSRLEMQVRYLLRLPDCIDITRVLAIPEQFPHVQETGDPDEFDAKLLLAMVDPEMQKLPAFMSGFYDVVSNSSDLAAVTGGASPHDKRPEPDYARKHGLIDLQRANPVRKRMVSHSPDACKTIDQALDDNVRREIASLAGIPISSDYELRQIPLPDLSLLEKFQIHRREVRQKLTTASQQLKASPPLHPLGTLTQELLESKPVRKRLAERGVEVFKVKRQRADELVTLWSCRKVAEDNKQGTDQTEKTWNCRLM